VEKNSNEKKRYWQALIDKVIQIPKKNKKIKK
jgi:hypothetical protein